MSIIADPKWTITTLEELERIAKRYPLGEDETYTEGEKQMLAFARFLTYETHQALTDIGAFDDSSNWRFSNGGHKADVEIVRGFESFTITVSLNVVSLSPEAI